jgi:hypothetical protein
VADADVARDALNQARQWVFENVDFDVTNVEVSGEYLIVDLRVTGPLGKVWFDDRIRTLRPPLRTPDGTFTTTTLYRRANGQELYLSAAEFNALTSAQRRALTASSTTWARPNYVLAPRLAMLRDLWHTAKVVTKDWTVPHIMRLPDGTLLGDTLTAFGVEDGYLQSSNTSIATARAGSGVTATLTNPNNVNLQPAGGSTFRFRMSFMAFDTSSLTSGATISAAVLSLAGTGNNEVDADNYNLEAKFHDYGSGDPATGDWFNVSTTGWTGKTTLGTFDTSSWNGTADAYNAFSDSGNGDGSVSKTGTTRVVVGFSGFPASTPTGDNLVLFRSSEQASTTSDPKLVITYTVGTPVTGTLASTLQRALFTGTGTQAQSGSIASTLQRATASLTGTQAQSGTVASTMQRATFSATGVMHPSGAIASTLRAATFAAEGTSVAPEITGTMAATLTRATASFTGVMEPSGAIASTLQPALFTATGTQAQSGSIASTLQAATFAATGLHSQTGAIISTLQRALFSATGVMHPTGAISSTMQAALFTASGTAGFEGAIAATLQPATAVFTGVMQPSGIIAVTLLPATFTALGTQAITGTMAATLQYVLFEGIGAIPIVLLLNARYAPLEAANARYGPLADHLARYGVRVKAVPV